MFFFSLVPAGLISNMVVLQVLKNFAGATSIHGLAFIVDTRLSVFKRVTWSLIFTAAIMWASIQLQFAVTSKLRIDFLRIRLRHKSLLFFWLWIGVLSLVEIFAVISTNERNQIYNRSHGLKPGDNVRWHQPNYFPWCRSVQIRRGNRLGIHNSDPVNLRMKF